MKNLLATALIASSIAGFSQEEQSHIKHVVDPQITHHHVISPKVFYRSYYEKGFEYTVYGGGWEYSYASLKGLNFKMSGITNGRKEKAFHESNITFFFQIPIYKNQWIHPIFSHRTFSKNMGRSHDADFSIHKGTTFLGVGWELVPQSSWRLHLEGCLSHDLFNMATWCSKDFSSHRHFSTPYGFRAKAGALFECNEGILLDVEGFYAQTFRKEYKTVGLEISCKVVF